MALRSSTHTRRQIAQAMAGRPATLALSSLAVFAAAPSHAQEQQPEAAPILEEIQVTGSRIGRTGFTSPVPVTSMSADELRDMEPASTVSQQLDQLPQFLNTSTTQQDTNTSLFGGAGQAHLDMRGMGRERTLVLLDGSRIVPSDRWSSVNVDYFPSALIQRVEVVTGGASAAYGADALAGVTNFILNREFTGLATNVQMGTHEHGDGDSWSADVAFGTPIGDRMHIIGSLETRDVDEIRRRNAPWHLDWGYVTNPDWIPGDPSSGPQRLVRPFVHSTDSSPTGMIFAPGFSHHRHTFLRDGLSTRPFGFGDYATVGTGTQNQSGGPEYEIVRESNLNGPTRNQVKQRTGFLGLNYEINDSMTLWGNALFGRVEAHGFGPGSFHASPFFAPIIFPENAFLPEDVRQAMIDEGVAQFSLPQSGAWSTDEIHRVRDINIHDMWSVTTGLDAELPGSWDLRASYQYGEADKHTQSAHRHRMDRLFLAMDSVLDEDGNAVCRIQMIQRQLAAQGRNLEEELHAWAQANTSFPRHDAGRDPDGNPIPIDYPISVDSVDNTISDCVPMNPFGFQPASAEAKHYIEDPYGKVGQSTVRQNFAEVMVNGQLHGGWGPGPIMQALGVTYRDESIRQGVDARTDPIDRLGPPLNVTLDDGTVAIRGIPPGFAGGSPNLHFFSTVPTFSGGFDVWEVFSETIVPLYASPNGQRRVELNLAGRFAEYSRAGSVSTYKAGLDVHVTNGLRFRGTLSRDVREGSFSEQFDQQGGGAFIDDPANDWLTQFTTVIAGGNPEIEPEAADTIVLGLVYQPQGLPGLQLSADYYDIDLTDVIGQLSPQRLVENCHFDGINCDLVVRDPVTGSLQRIFNVFLNIDDARIRGVDMEAAYRTQPRFFANRSESFVVRMLAGYLKENSETLLGGQPFDRAGGTTRPKWTATATATYNAGPFGVRLQQRYIDSTLRNVSWIEGIDVEDNKNPAQYYTNLRLSYTQDGANGSWTASLNVNNLFDRDPPAGPSINAGIFDQLGRRYSLSFGYRF